MVTTYILSILDFTNRADITNNIDTAKLKSYLGVIQEKFAKKILCKTLYDQLLTQISGTLSTANTTLLPYVKDYLIYKTYSRYLLNAGALSTPAGIRTMSEPTSTPASVEYIGALIKQSDGDANFYQDELVNFLKNNEDDYPLWASSSCGCGTLTKNNNQFSKVGRKKYIDDKINYT